MNPNSIKKAALTVALLVLTALFIGLLVDAIYDYPEYDEYCTERDYMEPPRPYPMEKIPGEERTTCEPVNETLTNKCYDAKGFVMYSYDAYGCPTFKKCNTCNIELEGAQKLVNEKAFYLGMFLSLIIIVVGMFWPVEFIGTGFMFGGVVGLFYSTVRYFADMNKLFRVGVVLFEIVVIIGIAYLKLVEKKNGVTITEKIKRKTRFGKKR